MSDHPLLDFCWTIVATVLMLAMGLAALVNGVAGHYERPGST